MKKKSKIILICAIAAPILALVIFAVCRYRANVSLGHELRKEADAWLASLPKIPDEQNGAPVINRAVAQFEDFHDVFQDWNPRIDSEAAATTFRNYLAGKKEAFDLLEKGLAYEKWAYTTDYEKGYEATIPNLLLFKTVGRVFALKGDLARKEGHNSDALKEYLNALHLATTLSESRQLITQMIYVAVCSTGLTRLAELLPSSSLSEKDLSRALKTLLKFHERQVDIKLAFETEYFNFAMVTSDILEGKTNMLALATGKEEELGLLGRIRTSKLVYDYTEDAEIYRRWRSIYQRLDTERFNSYSEVLPDLHSLFGEIVALTGSRRAIIAQIALPSPFESFKVVMETKTLFRGTIGLVAIRLYKAKNGALPENLEQLGELVPKDLLIDPFSGKNLIYRREGDDFYLYSAGYNDKDDGGKDKPIFEEEVHPEEVSDIVFHTPSAGK